MKKPKPATVNVAPKTRHIVFEKANTNVNDWVDKQVIMQTFHIAERTLQYYRAKKIIPCAKLGGKVFYYLPGLLHILEKQSSL